MSLVVDASVVAEVLLGTERGQVASQAFGEHQLIAPDLLSAEVLSVVRGWNLGGHLTDEEALRAIHEFACLGVLQIEAMPLLSEAFALRHNLSAYDALYVALARSVGCQLLTLDARLAAVAPDCAVIPTVQ